MLENKTHLKVTLQDKDYILTCDPDSPLGCLHDALLQMKGWTVARMIANQQDEEKMSEIQQKVDNEKAE